MPGSSAISIWLVYRMQSLPGKPGRARVVAVGGTGIGLARTGGIVDGLE
jgi:hypothetical protein